MGRNYTEGRMDLLHLKEKIKFRSTNFETILNGQISNVLNKKSLDIRISRIRICLPC